MSKFGALVANVDQPFKHEIISPVTGSVLRDKHGVVAFIEVYSIDSPSVRQIDKERRAAQGRQARAGDFELPDNLEDNFARCAAVTKSWHLVDPASLDPLDVPCTRENALELYSEPGLNWLFVQAWLTVNRTANFMKRPSNGSLATASQSGEAVAG